METSLEPCGSPSVECAYARIGERWMYSDIDLDTRGGNNNVNAAGQGGSLAFTSRSKTPLSSTVISASNVDLRGNYQLTGGEGFGRTAQGGGGGALSVGDVAHIAFGATLDTSGGAAKGSAGNGGTAGGFALSGFFVNVTGNLTANGGASAAGRPGSCNEGTIYGYRITVDGDITFNGAGAGTLEIEASDELILNGDLTGNGTGAQNGVGFAGGNVALAANHGTGNGTITLNGATLTNLTYAANSAAAAAPGCCYSILSTGIRSATSRCAAAIVRRAAMRSSALAGRAGTWSARRAHHERDDFLALMGRNGAVSASTGGAVGGDAGGITLPIGATSVINNTGTITANGGNATGSATNAAYGGSGGSLNVFSNSGTLQAKGGETRPRRRRTAATAATSPRPSTPSARRSPAGRQVARTATSMAPTIVRNQGESHAQNHKVN